jgi:hypothetical protein
MFDNRIEGKGRPERQKKKELGTQINEKCNDVNSIDENKKYPTSGLTTTG